MNLSFLFLEKMIGFIISAIKIKVSWNSYNWGGKTMQKNFALFRHIVPPSFKVGNQ